MHKSISAKEKLCAYTLFWRLKMKILLCEDVEKVGFLGDVIEVNEGYARNYLLPQRRGVIPTEANLRSLAQEKAKHAEQRLRERKRLEQAAKAVENAEAVVASKANEQGSLFGSVGPAEIAENLRQQGFDVVDQMVQMHEHIKQVGTSKVTLRFAADLTVQVNVVVVAKADTGEQSS